MKTQVVMKRPFMGGEISQQSKTEMFSATDLTKIINRKRRELEKPAFNMSAYLKTKGSVEFIEELQKESEKVIVRSKGKGTHTWVHPLLFLDIALSANPKLKIEVYKWLYDELIKNRNNSGDSYKKMCGYLFDNHGNKSEFPVYIMKVARFIRTKCMVDNWNSATNEQLKLRDKMHENISLLTTALRDNNQAVRLGIEEALK